MSTDVRSALALLFAAEEHTPDEVADVLASWQGVTTIPLDEVVDWLTSLVVELVDRLGGVSEFAVTVPHVRPIEDTHPL